MISDPQLMRLQTMDQRAGSRLALQVLVKAMSGLKSDPAVCGLTAEHIDWKASHKGVLKS